MNTKDKWGRTAWHLACIYGRTEIAQLIIRYSKDFGIDLNAKDKDGLTAWHLVCFCDQTETALVIIQNSKEVGIDLNAKNNSIDRTTNTALHWACYSGKTKTVQMILKNWKEFGIDIKAQDNEGKTALDEINDLINHWKDEESNQIKKMLEEEYSQIDVTESVENLNLD